MLPRLDLRLTCDGVPVIGTVPGVSHADPTPQTVLLGSWDGARLCTQLSRNLHIANIS